MAIQMTEEQFQTLMARFTELGNPIQRNQDEQIPDRGGSLVGCDARFKGERDDATVEEFISKTTIYKRVTNVSDANAIEGLPLLLQGEASTWWTGVRNQVTTWDQAVKLLRSAFAPERPAHWVYLDIFSSSQDKQTTTDQFICEKRALFARLPDTHTEAVQLNMVYGLLRREIREHLPRADINSYADLLHRARLIEANLREAAQTSKPRIEERQTKKPRCDFCHFPGHTIQECRKKRKPEKENQQPASDTQLKCYGCNRPGYTRSKCPDCNKTTAPPARDLSFYYCQAGISLRSRPAVEITILGKEGTAYLDSGSHLSIASPGLLGILRANGIQPKKETAWITLADGHKTLREMQSLRAPVTLKGRTTHTTFYHFPDTPLTSTTLLGIDFLEDAGITVNFKQQNWHYAGSRHRAYKFTRKDVPTPKGPNLRPETPTDAEVNAILAESTHTQCPTSPPNSPPINIISDVVSGLCDNYGPEPPTSMDTTPLASTPQIPWTKPKPIEITTKEDKRFEYMFEDAVLQVGNYDDYPSDHIRTYFSCALQVENLHLREDEGMRLSKEERRQLEEVLLQHRDIFKEHGPPTELAEHRIDTKDHAPISSPPYRLTPNRHALLTAEVNRLLDEGIIEACESAWSAPVVLVPKRTGGIRMCVDYRQLNAITVPDVYPLPRIDDLLHSTGRTLLMSTMDLRAGYHQIRVRKEDQDKTAFITPFGTYRFTRLPFGLRNAPSTFQRLIDRFKIGIKSGHLLAYLDDLILLSPTFTDHICTLREIFQRLGQFSLRLNREKCHFGNTRVKYLGHIITPEGMQTDPDKVTAITQREPPRNLKQLQSFLQTCSWYRRFIPRFAEITHPLTRLTRKDAAWEWGPNQKIAYSQLQKALTTAPILQAANHALPYTLRTDASAYALGAALLQGEGTQERPIEYASRLLLPAERNYSTTEREALAVVWAVAKFRGYLEESTTIVITDHQPLKWLLTLKTPTGRLARWALQLQPYNLQIDYTPGKANVVADTLSRPTPIEEPAPTAAVCSITADFPNLGVESLRAEQLRDADLRKILDCFATNNPEDISRWTARGYITSQGILYRYAQDGDEEDAQLVIPSHKRLEVLQAHHDAPTAGHYGAQRTLLRIQRLYFWPGMRRDVYEYAQKCTACQKYKAGNQKPPGLLQTPVMQQRFEVIAIDLFGPLPTGPSGEKWILIAEDTASRWVELFPLRNATAEACGWTLLHEIFFRFGLPRRIISDNGTQFVSQIMQYLSYCLQIQQTFTPVYHPAANPVERKNRDLKAQLSIRLGNEHADWPDKLPSIRFSMNSATTQATGFTPAYLTFGRELRTPYDVTHDVRQVIRNEAITPEITSKLASITDAFFDARETHEKEQDRRKTQADKHLSSGPTYDPGDLVWVETHPISQASKGYSGKFAPKRDGPYVILARRGPCSYEVAAKDRPTELISTYHTSALRPVNLPGETPLEDQHPLRPLRRRGRPKKPRPE